MRGRFLYANDQAGHYPAQSYYTATAQLLAPFPSLQGEESADVCIVGAGYTGLSAALHLAQAGFKVIVLEAHRVGWGASGRNGGQVGTGLNKNQDELERRVGKKHAYLLWHLSLEAVQLCKTLIQTHQMDCDLQAGILYASHKARYVPAMHAYAERIQQEYGYPLLPLDQAALQQKLASPAYLGGVLNAEAAHLHPLNYVLGLARAATQAGVRIYECSAVTRYQSKAPIHIETAQGKVKANALLLACNGYLDQLEPRLAEQVMPINNYMVATEPLSAGLAASLIPQREAVADTRFVVNYFRFSAERRLLFGGGESYSFRFPADLRAVVRPRLEQVFPQLRGVSLPYAWGGTLGITLNRLPNFSQLQPNVYAVSGYSGHGVALATLAGKLVAEAIQGQQGRFDIFARLPKPNFPGGTLLRWPALVLAMLYYSLRDRL